MKNLRVITALLLLNTIPVFGVLQWQWQSSDLIFLYWMENLVIGGFVLLRMLIRPYSHPLELVYPLLLAPFFAFHYGMFCYVHGFFVVSLFGEEFAGATGSGLGVVVLQMLSSREMLAALLTLTLLQSIDWLREVHQRGLGTVNIKELMSKPYRRIVILHLTLLCGGFALAALDEPTVGLLLLVLIKALSDIWHWRRDSEQCQKANEFAFTDAHLAQMQEKFSEPKVVVNGKARYFDSFAELQNSGEFRLMQAVMRLFGAGEELKAMGTYLDLKIAEEQQISRPQRAAG